MRGHKAVLIYSGGLDSTVLLYFLLKQGRTVHAISFDYGQKHRKEVNAARYISEAKGIVFQEVCLTSLSPLLSSALTDPGIPIPDGHYEEESMKATVVPNRNMIFLSIAAGYAISIGADQVAYAGHAGDHAIYPDCRPEFFRAMDVALSVCDWSRIELVDPFIKYTKADIVKTGAILGVPFADTWSCYKGFDVHCGSCGTCTERREAFALAGIEDPTEYMEA